MDALLFIKMGVSETLCSYASWYWELYNEIGGGNEKIVASTFRMGLPENSELQESLTKRPSEDMRQLMRRIEECKRLEDDRLQSKGKAPLVNRSRPGIFPLRPRRDLRVQELEVQLGEVNVAFKEPVHKIVDQIKNESFFRWPKKMGGDPSWRNQNLYCTYHRDKVHTTEQCRVLKDHLGQLVKAGHLKEFVVEPGNRGPGLGAQQKGNLISPPLGVIEVIQAMPGSTNTARIRVFTVASTGDFSEDQPPTKRTKGQLEPIAFDDEDLEGMIQPHDDALVIAARISGFLVKRVMIDQGGRVDVMYPNLFKRLGFENQDLAKYESSLVSFDRRVVIPQG